MRAGLFAGFFFVVLKCHIHGNIQEKIAGDFGVFAIPAFLTHAKNTPYFLMTDTD